MKSLRYSMVFLAVLGLYDALKADPMKAHATSPNDTLAPKMQWFADAKLGIFIHWGIYSVDGTTESWSFHSRQTTYPQYMSQLQRFGAEKYDPKAWAALIKESGAQYAVITTKHHDGVAMYPTQHLTPPSPWSNNAQEPLSYPKGKKKVSETYLWNPKYPLSVMDQSPILLNAPARKDVMTPLVTALRAEGLKFGAYYSLLDWSHGDYPGFFKDQGRYKIDGADTFRWRMFLEFMHGQIGELSRLYNPDLFWFDGDWEHSNAEWNAAKIRRDILSVNPNAILNGRLQGFGDYATPEQNMPIAKPLLMGSDGKLHNAPWELCLTSNDNWGWRPNDTMMKSTNEVIRIFAECLGMGGNLLLDIGPKADGSITPEQTKLLKELGRWTSKHAEAIYGSKAGLPLGHFYGPSTMSKDSTILYLFVTQVQGMSREDKYIEEEELEDAINEVLGKSGDDAIEIDGGCGMTASIMVKGLRNEIESVQVLGTDFVIKPKVVGKISWSSVPGTVFMDVPFDALDEQVTVLKLKLKGPLRLYEGQGGFH